MAGLPEIRILSAAEAGVGNRDIADFYKAQWARPIALTRPEFCDWQFSAAPGAGGRNHSVLALRGDAILAVMGATPARFDLDGQALAGAELTTWVVAPEARGQGVGRGILAHLQARFDVLAGAGITAAALPLYLGAGFTFLAHIPRFFHVADFDRVQAFAPVSQVARQVQMQRQSRAEPQGWLAQEVPAAGLAAVGGPAGLGHFARDRDRLAWRHDHHPAFAYEAFLIRDPGRDGPGAGLVLREDRVLETPILHVIDLFGPPGHLPAAVAFAEAEARARGAAFVDISLTAGLLAGHLRARGWSSAVDDPLIELPSLFHPVELRRPPTTSMVIWGRTAQARLFDFGRLHVSRADMDLDRPTLHWYETAEKSKARQQK